MNQENEFLSWDSSFTAEESSFKLFQPGEYPFTVTNMERKIYDGTSTKIPNGAPYAEVTMEFTGPEGKTNVIDRLYLMKNWQWKLTQFFSGIGQSPVLGETFKPNWSQVVGSRGNAKLNINTYTSKGQERSNNQVEEYLASNAPAQQQQNNQQSFNQAPPVQNQQQNFNQNQANQPQNNGFQPGAF
ncbi:hypothetical protein CBF37_08190 [Vagococcus vulneris]|uniref:DUF669 domain-containing protein n=2 Tax=Vagococcus vulneris TaxID=1977869 RepID=A0A429ZWY2_9ENTE|nr:hypothetical protein CBF37_08190 [Vagococcus vulneris]